MDSIILMIVASASVALAAPYVEEEFEPLPPPPRDLQVRYLHETEVIKDKLLADYKSLISEYYKRKRSSTNNREFPNYDDGKMSSSVSEFSSSMLDEFPDLEKRFARNLFVMRLRAEAEQVGGPVGANDVFSRLQLYSMEKIGAQPLEIRMGLRELVGNPMTTVASFEAHEIFNEISKANGYPGNFKRMTNLDGASQVNKKAKLLAMKELAKARADLGDDVKALAKKGSSAGDACSIEFSKLAK